MAIQRIQTGILRLDSAFPPVFIGRLFMCMCLCVCVCENSFLTCRHFGSRNSSPSAMQASFVIGFS